MSKQSVSSLQNQLNFTTHDLLLVRIPDTAYGDVAGVVIKVEKDYLKLLLSSGEISIVRSSEVIQKISKSKTCNDTNFICVRKGD